MNNKFESVIQICILTLRSSLLTRFIKRMNTKVKKYVSFLSDINGHYV